MIVQLNPTIPMITPLGFAHAHFMWTNDRLIWFGVFQEETGENWWWLNDEVRFIPSISDDQFTVSPIELHDAKEEALKPIRRRYRPPFGTRGK